jgi:CSLREA domain-containing protein
MMSTRPLGYILITIAAALILLALAGQSFATVQATSRQAAASNTYLVNSTADTVDADVTNAVCADAGGHCTLRAAIMQANFATG